MAIKRCPTCNQEFTDEWLTFCTNDGTSLVTVDRSSEEPPPTIISMPPSMSPLEQPTMDMPGTGSSQPQPYKPPDFGQFRAPQPGPMQPGWKAPPPPAYPRASEKNLALVSMIFGILSLVGTCCYFGILTGPVAVGLGIYALMLIKKDPNKYGGKGMAITGIVTGGLSLVLVLLFFLFYGLSLFMGGFN